MCRIQRSGKYPLWLRVSPRGLRALPQLGKCNSDPETWCARCVWPLPTARTKSHVLNRIFPVAAACAVPNKLMHSKSTVHGVHNTQQ